MALDKKTLKTPPGPKGGLMLGSTIDFKNKPARYIKHVADAYGDVTRFKVVGVNWYMLCHPEDVWRAMTKQGHIFLKPAIAKRLWDKFLGDGLLTTEGEVWKRQHKLMIPAFHHKRIMSYGETMGSFTNRMLDGWEEGSRVDIGEAMVALTLEIIAKTMFNADVGEDGTSTVGDAMSVIQEVLVEHINMPIPVPKWWPSEANKRKINAIQNIEDIVMGIVDERRRTGEDPGDLLSMLLNATDETGDRLTDKELRDQSMTLFFAGHETTAFSMTWAWYLFGKHPEITARVQADIDRVTEGEPLTVAHLKELPYLEQCVKEAMRILPSVWIFMKQPTEDVDVRGYLIPKGAPVAFSPYIIHRDPRWYPSPLTFDPDRFSPEREKLIPKGAYIPFSGGARVCIGKACAMMESCLVLGTMLQRLTPKVSDDYVYDFKAELSMHPGGPLPIDVVFRQQATKLVATA